MATPFQISDVIELISCPHGLADGNAKGCSHFDSGWQFLKTLSIELQPSNSTPRCIPKRNANIYS